MKVSKTFIVDVPCPLCNSSETAGPFECKRCGLEVCVECRELSELNVDLHRKRILCKPCVSAVEAEVALESLAGLDKAGSVPVSKNTSKKSAADIFADWPTLPAWDIGKAFTKQHER